jgi:hypothetical protein
LAIEQDEPVRADGSELDKVVKWRHAKARSNVSEETLPAMGGVIVARGSQRDK